ncbi:unnamed protein product [Boreogadus saida]
MVCSVPDYELHLNIMRSVFVLQEADAHSSVFYGVFGLEWKNIKASAICQYSFADVQSAFDGPYMEVLDSKWREYTGKVPEPRPGSCITDVHRSQGINSSRDLPDSVLTFARRHPLVAGQVHPVGARPLMFKRNVNYVKIAVHKVTALDGDVYPVFFLGTDHGWLHRAVDIAGEMHIIEELQLFDKPQPIESLVLSPIMRSVFVGSHSAVVQVPMATCRRYTSCYDCVFARDPFCAWDRKSCVEVRPRGPRSNLTQDIIRGTRGCRNSTGYVAQRGRSVMAGDDVLLRCELHSNLATPRWTLNGRELQGYSLAGGYRVGTDGLLIVGARPAQGGTYRCFAVENAIWVPVRQYSVRVHTDPGLHGDNADTTGTPSPTPSPDPTEPPPVVVAATGGGPTERPLPSPPAPLPSASGSGGGTYRHMEAVYVSLVAVLGGLCLVLTVVLLYVSCCTAAGNRRRRRGRGRKFSQQGLQILGETEEEPRRRRRGSSPLELRTVSGGHCNGRLGGARRRSDSLSSLDDPLDGFLQIVAGGGHQGRGGPASPCETPPAAPPLPPPSSSSAAQQHSAPTPTPPPPPPPEFANGGLSGALPSVLRKMNGNNSYVLLRQVDQEGTSPLYHSFTEELNRILEQRKHTQLDDVLPDESSI